MEKIIELAAKTQAAIDALKNNCILYDYDTCRQRWDLEIELERLMILYHECKDAK